MHVSRETWVGIRLIIYAGLILAFAIGGLLAWSSGARIGCQAGACAVTVPGVVTMVVGRPAATEDDRSGVWDCRVDGNRRC